MGKNILIVILAIVVLGIAGYFIAQNYQASTPQTTETLTSPSTQVPSSKATNTTEDRMMADKATTSQESMVTISEIKEFDVIAKQFMFEPELITVNTGDTVILNIKSLDVIHGIAIREFNVSQILEPNTSETVEFVASKPGTYKIFCSIACGSGHTTMKGTLVVK